MKTHVCLVSEQAAANLLPALDPTLKPDEIVLVVSRKMKSRAMHLESVLKENGIRVRHVDLEDEHNYAGTEAQLLELAAGLNSAKVALNLTGGTKLMSIAAQSVAQASDWRMFYADVDTDKISWLGGERLPPSPLGEHLRLRHYLKSYGYTIEGDVQRPSVGAARQSLVDTLVVQIGSLEQALSQLNWLAQQAEDARTLGVTMDERQQDSRGLDALLRHFAEAGALTVKNATLRFPDEASRDFVKGGWLELHVFQTISVLSGELCVRDKAANLRLIDSTGVRNEFDAAFMAHNRLFVIECKTARMDRPEAPKANEALFKLAENCRRIGGLGTRGMLVSYRPLRDSEKKLAKALRIELICGAEIVRLEERLKTWVNMR